MDLQVRRYRRARATGGRENGAGATLKQLSRVMDLLPRASGLNDAAGVLAGAVEALVPIAGLSIVAQCPVTDRKRLLLASGTRRGPRGGAVGAASRRREERLEFSIPGGCSVALVLEFDIELSREERSSLTLLGKVVQPFFSGFEFEDDPVSLFCEMGLKLPDGRLVVGRHPLMRQLFARIRRVAPTNTTVLIRGETGTGKELIARALHDLGPRARGPWIVVNCSAFPEDLIENELFGHTEGSFTGASRSQKGLVEAAAGGTLFLDEIATMPLRLQSRLLRVLEGRSVRRIGGSLEQIVDVRIVAATNQRLEALVDRGEFREDLFHRLSVIEVDLPALRNRPSDISLLADHFLARLGRSEKSRRQLSREASEALNRYHYPGNVRELSNIIESGFHQSSGPRIRLEEIGRKLLTSSLRPGNSTERSEALYRRLRDGLDFWKAVRDPFLARDLCRSDVRELVSKGLAEVGGSYRRLVEEFNLPEKDYHRFLAFLSHHGCKVDFRAFRRRSTGP